MKLRTLGKSDTGNDPVFSPSQALCRFDLGCSIFRGQINGVSAAAKAISIPFNPSRFFHETVNESNQCVNRPPMTYALGKIDVAKKNRRHKLL